MPSVSKSQQRLMGMAHAEQAGHDTGSAKAKDLAGSMDSGDVKDFAETGHKGLPEKKAFVGGFLTKCAELGLSETAVSKMVYGICRQDSEASGAFQEFLKEAFDLSTIPPASTPKEVPSRLAESEPTPVPASQETSVDTDKSRMREIMQKKYAGADKQEWSFVDFLATPVTV